MNALIFQLCVYAAAGWVNRGQQQVIDYLIDENRVLRQQLGGRRLRLGGTLKYNYGMPHDSWAILFRHRTGSGWSAGRRHDRKRSASAVGLD